MQRIAAVDFGLKRIGLAISDASGKIALPLKRIDAGRSLQESAQGVLAALESYRKELLKILVGLPLLMNGTRGEMANLVESFAQKLRDAGAQVECVDERLSSAQAERALRELDMNRKERAKAVDSTSATLLLQAYLDRRA